MIKLDYSLNFLQNHRNKTEQHVQDCISADINGLRIEMLNMYWDLLLNGLDTEDSWSLFRSNILELSDKYIPKKE